MVNDGEPIKLPSAFRRIRRNKVDVKNDDQRIARHDSIISSTGFKGFKGRKMSQLSQAIPIEDGHACTEAEIAEFKQIFSMFDTDNSGAIGKEELKQAMIRIGVAANEHEIEDLIDEVDEDGNGEIDFAEFCDCLKKTQQRAKKSTKEEITRQCFEIFDQDRNGVISEAEFKYIAKEIGEFDDQLAEYVFNELDTCSNGILTADQFAAVVEDYLFSYDDEFTHTSTKLSDDRAEVGTRTYGTTTITTTTITPTTTTTTNISTTTSV